MAPPIMPPHNFNNTFNDCDIDKIGYIMIFILFILLIVIILYGAHGFRNYAPRVSFFRFVSKVGRYRHKKIGVALSKNGFLLTDKFDPRGFVWHADIGYRNNLSTISHLPDEFVPKLYFQQIQRSAKGSSLSMLNISVVNDLVSDMLYDGHLLPSGKDGYWDSFLVDKDVKTLYITRTLGPTIKISKVRSAMKDLGMMNVSNEESFKYQLVVLCIDTSSNGNGLTYLTLRDYPLSLINWRDIEVMIQPNESRRIAHRVKSYLLLPKDKDIHIKAASKKVNGTISVKSRDYMRMVCISRDLSDSLDKDQLIQRIGDSCEQQRVYLDIVKELETTTSSDNDEKSEDSRRNE